MIDRRSFSRLLAFGAATAAARALGGPPPRPLPPKKIVRPRRLVAGNTVGLALPATAAFERDGVALAREQLEALGFKVEIGRHAYDRHGYFAGSDRDRAADLNRMFADPRIAGIVCYTGGWGSPRILPLLDYEVIARNPKVFIGYSDITALLNGIHQRTGLVTFHGPTGDSALDPYSLENFRRVVMSPEPAGLLAQPPKRPADLVERANRIVKIAPGRASGRLCGGNLTLLSVTMGTPYAVETEGSILLLEDVREDLYRIDRMLTQLALSGKLARVAGVVFGRCTECGFRGPTFSLEQILAERFGALGIPAISGLSFGHIEQKLTLPIGVRATLDGGAGTLSLDEPAVL